MNFRRSYSIISEQVIQLPPHGLSLKTSIMVRNSIPPASNPLRPGTRERREKHAGGRRSKITIGRLHAVDEDMLYNAQPFERY